MGRFMALPCQKQLEAPRRRQFAPAPAPAGLCLRRPVLRLLQPKQRLPQAPPRAGSRGLLSSAPPRLAPLPRAGLACPHISQQPSGQLPVVSPSLELQLLSCPRARAHARPGGRERKRVTVLQAPPSCAGRHFVTDFHPPPDGRFFFFLKEKRQPKKSPPRAGAASGGDGGGSSEGQPRGPPASSQPHARRRDSGGPEGPRRRRGR